VPSPPHHDAGHHHLVDVADVGLSAVRKYFKKAARASGKR